jgi:hypothetical protein
MRVPIIVSALAGLVLSVGCGPRVRSAAPPPPPADFGHAPWNQPNPAEPPPFAGTPSPRRPDPRRPASLRGDALPAPPPAAGVVRSEREQVASVRRGLAQPIERIIWPNIPWHQAVDDIREQTGLNIVLIETALENEGLGPERKVSTDSKGLTGEQAIKLLFRLVGTGDTPASRPAAYVSGNAILITTAARARIAAEGRPIIDPAATEE